MQHSLEIKHTLDSFGLLTNMKNNIYHFSLWLIKIFLAGYLPVCNTWSIQAIDFVKHIDNVRLVQIFS